MIKKVILKIGNLVNFKTTRIKHSGVKVEITLEIRNYLGLNDLKEYLASKLMGCEYSGERNV